MRLDFDTKMMLHAALALVVEILVVLFLVGCIYQIIKLIV